MVTVARMVESRPVRFLLVGVTGVGVSSAVLWVGRHPLGLPTAAAGLLSGVISTFTNFQLNDVFTWRDQRSRTTREKLVRMVRYYSTTAMGTVISLGVLVVLTDWLGIYLLLSNLVAIGVGGTFNYILHNVWTWRGGKRG
jgi:putative flippase GtrA